jgi:hypothetical protein
MPEAGEVDTTTETGVQPTAAPETDKTNNDDAKKAKAEAARMAKALAEFQKKVAELEDFKKAAEREKLTAEERIKAEKDDLAAQLRSQQESLAAAKVELEQERLTNKLIANGLEDPDFGGLLLKNYNSEDESFEDFVSRMKASKKFGRFFSGTKAEQVETPRAPTAPNSGSQRGNRASDEVSDADKRLAEERYPKDKAKQSAFLKNLVEARRVRKQNEVDYGRG